MQKTISKLVPIILLLLGGCSAVGPDYTPPDITMAEQWRNSSQTAGPESEALAQWWTTLQDPLLVKFIEDALRENLDLQQAQSRVRQARYERVVSSSSLYPAVDAAGAAGKSYSKEHEGRSSEINTFSAGFDASWEIDLFGGVRRSVEASQADYEAAVEEMRDTRVSLAAEVAIAYVDIRAYQTRLRVTRDEIASQEETLFLLTALSEAGRGDELAITQARYNLESARAAIPDMETSLEKSMNSLAILVGQPAGSLRDSLTSPQPVPAVSAELAVGIPADVLRRRPDIRMAERQLAAETARIGQAEAQLYPQLNLKGSIGLESTTFAKLFSEPTSLWSIGPSVSWPIFHAGELRNQVNIQTEQQQQAFFSYKTAILTATEEVENALTAYAKEQEKKRHLELALENAKLAEELAKMQYAAGVAEFTNVLEAQRSLLSFEDQLAQSSATIVTDLISLYKVLGGGWHPLSEDNGDVNTEQKQEVTDNSPEQSQPRQELP